MSRQLGDLRDELSVRLGFGALGSAAVANKPILDSFIRGAQAFLLNEFEWRHLQRVSYIDLGQDQQFADYPDRCEPDGVRAIYLDGRPLEEGAPVTDERGHPTRYERRDQIEFWPVTTKAVRLRVEHDLAVLPLVEDDDLVSLNHDLILLHALAFAKAHYRQPDAEGCTKALSVMLSGLKAKNRGTHVLTTRHDRGLPQPTAYRPTYQP